MARATMPYALLLLTLLAGGCCALVGQPRASAARRLLHDSSSSDSDTAPSESYLDTLQAQGLTSAERLDQVLGVPASGGLDEDGVNTLLQDVQGWDFAVSKQAQSIFF